MPPKGFEPLTPCASSKCSTRLSYNGILRDSWATTSNIHAPTLRFMVSHITLLLMMEEDLNLNSPKTSNFPLDVPRYSHGTHFSKTFSVTSWDRTNFSDFSSQRINHNCHRHMYPQASSFLTFGWWSMLESNQRPFVYQTNALTTELMDHITF